MKIISPRTPIHQVEYHLSFAWNDNLNCGLSFPCDKDGKLIEDKLTELSRENYKKCLSGEFNVTAKGIETYEWTYVEPAIGECVCGDEVQLEGFTNTCDKCERDYNFSGQLLASREQWTEGTDESLSDILRIR